MKQSAESIAPLNTRCDWYRVGRCCDREGRWIRCRQLQGPMRAMAVVVINEDLKHTFEMPFVDDKQPIEAFGTNRPNEPLGDSVGLRCLNRRPHNSQTLRLKHPVEAARELAS